MVYFDCSSHRADIIKSVLNRFPRKLGDTLTENNFKLKILIQPFFEKEIRKTGGEFFAGENGVTSGLFAPFWETIYINANYSEEYLFENIAHELGHFCDWIMGLGFSYCSNGDSKLFEVFYDMKRNNYLNISEYYLSNNKEFLAYCFSRFFVDSGSISLDMFLLAKRYLLSACS